MQNPKTNVVDFAAVRALRIAMNQSSPPGEVLDADQIMLEATRMLYRLTEENARLRRSLADVTEAGRRAVRRLTYELAIGLGLGLIVARFWS